MSEDDSSPIRMPVRVKNIFELAIPIQELPPDPDAVAMSPDTFRLKEKEMDDLLMNAKCEDGTSMASVAKYIPSKATLKRMEEEAAAAKKTLLARKAAKIAELEARIEQLRRDSFDDTSIDETTDLDQLTISRPTAVFAETGNISLDGTSQTVQRASMSSPGSVTVVSSPTIGVLAAAPTAIGALMGASPGVGALVAAALNPVQQNPSEKEDPDGGSLSTVGYNFRFFQSID